MKRINRERRTDWPRRQVGGRNLETPRKHLVEQVVVHLCPQRKIRFEQKMKEQPTLRSFMDLKSGLLESQGETGAKRRSEAPEKQMIGGWDCRLGHPEATLGYLGKVIGEGRSPG